MAHASTASRGDVGTRDAPISGKLAALMLLDLAHHVQLTAPPRTWVQGPNQPGSRRFLQELINAASAMHGRPLPYRTASIRRTDAAPALKRVLATLGAEGSWRDANPQLRHSFETALAAGTLPLPSPALKIARTGQVPLSEKETARLRRRAKLQ